METLIVIIIVGLAAWGVGRRLWRSLQPSPQSTCGCSGGCGGCATPQRVTGSGRLDSTERDCGCREKPEPGCDAAGNYRL